MIQRWVDSPNPIRQDKAGIYTAIVRGILLCIAIPVDCGIFKGTSAIKESWDDANSLAGFLGINVSDFSKYSGIYSASFVNMSNSVDLWDFAKKNTDWAAANFTLMVKDSSVPGSKDNPLMELDYYTNLLELLEIEDELITTVLTDIVMTDFKEIVTRYGEKVGARLSLWRDISLSGVSLYLESSIRHFNQSANPFKVFNGYVPSGKVIRAFAYAGLVLDAINFATNTYNLWNNNAYTTNQKILGTTIYMGGLASGFGIGLLAASAVANLWNPYGWIVGGAIVIGGGFAVYYGEKALLSKAGIE